MNRFCCPEQQRTSTSQTEVNNNVTPYLIRGRLGGEGKQVLKTPVIARSETTKQSCSNNVTPHLMWGRLSGEGNKSLKTAFSLIELMISLIVVSCITAAFTPVITKKLKSGSLIAGSVGDAFRNSKMGLEDCKEYTGIDNCMFCDIKKKECKICAGSACDISHQYTVSKNCTCGECSSLFTDCARCTEQKCEACIAGKYFSNNSCKPVSDYPGCEGSKCYTDPNANPPITDPKPCPDGSICPNGIKIDCTTEELTHKLCKDGTSSTCPNGSICNNGIETKCTASNLTNTLCKDGTSKTCPEGSTCTNGIATPCTGQPNSIWCVNGKPTTCPEGNTCSNGIHTSCSGKPVSTWCINGIPTTCPEGNTCQNGKKTPCTGVASTTRCLNGATTPCSAGYFCTNGVQPNSQCKTGCAECAGANSCSTCASGKYLSGGNCENCPANTSTCSGSDFTCKTGYYKSGSTCGKCNSACSACTDSGTSSCTSCNSGYWKSGNTCNSCPAGASCNGVNVTSCPANAWLSSNSCLSCPSHATCAGGTDSYVCTTGWTGTNCAALACTWGWWKGSTKVDGPWTGWTYSASSYGYYYSGRWWYNNYPSSGQCTWDSVGDGDCNCTGSGHRKCAGCYTIGTCPGSSVSWSGGPNQWSCK